MARLEIWRYRHAQTVFTARLVRVTNMYYGSYWMIDSFRILSSPEVHRYQSRTQTVFVKADLPHSRLLLNRCWPRIGRVAASKVTDTKFNPNWQADCHDFRAHDTRIAATCKVVCCETTDDMCSCGGLFVFNGLYGLFFHSCSCFGHRLALSRYLCRFPTGLFPDDWLRLAVSFRHTWPIHVDWNSMQAGWSLNLVSPGPSWVYTPAVSLAYLPYVHG